MSQAEVAVALGVAHGSVSKWAAARRERGEDGLIGKPHPGPEPALSDAQLAELEQALLKGPAAHGWTNDLWTCPRVAALVERRFGVSYTPQHIGVILRERLGWSAQKPETASRERDEDKIEAWRTVEWPRIKKRPVTRAAPLSS